MAKMAEEEQFHVGQRIFDKADKALGTVKFIGEVGNTKGVWMGVDWDSPSRGKHDGIHEGKKYFETTTPTSGSFVRPAKIASGISFGEAVRDRYGSSTETDPKQLEQIR